MYGSSGAKMWDSLRLGAVVGPFRDHFEGLNAVKKLGGGELPATGVKTTLVGNGFP